VKAKIIIAPDRIRQQECDAMLRVNGERLLADLRQLAQFGQVGTGVDRVALSRADLDARQWLLRRMQDAGLATQMDEVANVYGRYPGVSKALLLGSHTDTVPNGGWLDGALGVAYAVEIARAAVESGPASAIGIDVISFQDEEGTFLPFLGSRTFCNDMSEAELDGAKSGELSLRAALAGIPGSPNPPRLDPSRHVCYLEAHIEQGPRLEAAQRRIGVVSALVGIRRLRIRTRGRADHTGTTPMGMRKDAGAVLFRLAARIAQEFPRLGAAETVWNIGSMALRPGAANVVPGEAEMVLEFRDIDSGILDRLEHHVSEWVDELSEVCPIETHCLVRMAPTPMMQELADVLATCAKARGEEAMHMPSGAGHDAMIMARFIPAAMLFVPSIGGRSHDVTEDTAEEDIVFGCQVLADAVSRLRNNER
jgi:beta-ureidopropionase / N-carbamoyl-L-amino-acid hydrolase